MEERERDPNQRSFKMDGAQRGTGKRRRRRREVFNRGGSVGKDVGREQECKEERWF